MFNKLKFTLPLFLILIFSALCVSQEAHAQFNAFKDPAVKQTKAKVADTDLVAVERDVKGGQVAVGETAHYVVIFKNRRATPVKVSNIQLYPSSTVTSKITLNQCTTIPLSQDSQCAVTVSVTGKQAGAFRVEMLVEHDGQSRITTATISGNVEGIEEKLDKVDGAELSISPANLDFGSFAGGVPLSKSISLRNNSAENIKLKSIGLNVSPKAGFSYESLCPNVLRKEASCNIILTWAPNLKGKSNGVLTIDHTGKAGTSFLEFKGTYTPTEKKFEDIVEGNIEFSTDLLDFGKSDGSMSRTRSVTLSNETLKEVSVTDIAIEASEKAGFTYLSKCPEALKPSGKCVIVVNWKPTTPGLSQGVLTLKHTGKTSMADFEIRGEYEPPVAQEEEKAVSTGIRLSEELVDFGVATDNIEKIIPITVTNKTLKEVKLYDMAVKASNQSGLSYDTECFSSLKAGESCSVMIKWKPVTKGLSQGAFVLFHSGANGSESLKILGRYDPAVVEEGDAGKVAIAPEALDFGTSSGGMEMSRSVTLTNRTADTVTIRDIAIDASSKAGFSYKSHCPTMLTPGGECLIVVRWMPTAPGKAHGVLSVNHTGLETMSNLELTANYEVAEEEEAAGRVIANPADLDFGTVSESVSMSRSISVSNRTTEDVAIKDISIDASDNVGLTYKSKCPEILKAGSSCAVVVNWKPTLPGSTNGVLAISHSGEEAMAIVEIKGAYDYQEEDGEEGKVSIAPDLLDFGNSEGGVAMSRSVVLSNKTALDVNIGDISIDASAKAGFSYRSKCPAVLKTGGECVIVVSWDPNISGVANGVLTVNHSGEETMSTLELTGMYNPAEDEEEGTVTISPEALDFGSSSADILMSRSVVLSNNTDEDITVSEVTIDASAKAGFSQKSKCPTTLKAGADCVIVVAWKPDAEGSAQGVLTVNHSGEATISTLELTASYEPIESEEEKGDVSISPEALDFGSSNISILMSRSVVLSNNTDEDITVTNVEIDAARKAGFSQKSKCPAILKAGAECVIVVSWEPNAEGSAQGVLTVNHSGEETVSTLELTATYTPATEEEGSITISPEALDFGSVDVDTLMSRSVILSNNSDDDISIADIIVDSSSKAGFKYNSKCPSVLKAGASCVVLVNWKPDVKGAVNGVLIVNHSGEETMSTIEMTASYDPAEEEEGSITISPEALDFGSTDTSILMSRSVVLSNNTDNEVTIKEVAIDASSRAGFSYKSKCPATLTAGAECVIVVNWRADMEGSSQGVLTVSHSGEETMSTLELTGQYQPTEEEEGSITISPEELDFGTTDTSILMSRSVVLSNNSDDDVLIEDIAIDASAKAGFGYKSKCSSLLRAGAECVIVVTWEADIEGSSQGVLTVSHTGEETMSNLELTGVYQPTEDEEGRDVTISPEALDFGTADTSILMSRSVVLTNNSEKEITISDVAIDASSKAGFSYKSKCPATLKPSAECVIVLSWQADMEGVAQGVLTVSHSGEETMSTLELTATYQPEEEADRDIVISPEALDFGTSPDNILMSRSVVLTNKSNNDVTLGEVTIDASEKSGLSYKSKCPAILKSGAECVIIVSWLPAEEGAVHGVLTAEHSGEETISTLEITASYQPEAEADRDIVISPEALDFGVTDTSILMSRSVVLTNESNKDVTISEIAIDASSKAGFSYKSKCPALLKSGAECVIVLSWEADMEGVAQGVLTVSHSGEETMSTLELTATYQPEEEADRDIVISPEVLEFGDSADDILMSRSVVLTNKSNKDITLAEVAIDASKKSGLSYKSKCPAILKQGAECVIIVNWQPDAEGTVHGVLTASHSGEETISTLEITASYQPEEEADRDVVISPEALDFGITDTPILMSRSVVLTNESNKDVTISEVAIDASSKAGFSYKSKCPTILKAGAECVLVLSWEADMEGVAQGVLTVGHSGEETVSTLELTAAYQPEAAADRDVVISPEALDFGSTTDKILMTRSIVLTNETNKDITLGEVTIDASEKSGLSYKSKCPATLKAGAECVLIVSWLPEAEGAVHGVLTASHSGEETVSTLEITASYELEEDEGGVVISPEALDFGSSEGGITMSRSVVLSNDSEETITIGSIEIEASTEAGFSYKSKCPAELPADGECVIVVNWKPDAEGAAQGVLTVNHSGKETMATLELSATHAPEEDSGSIVVTPEELDLGTSDGVIPVSRSLVLTNESEEAITIENVEIIASSIAGFNIDSKCPEVLEPKAQCTIIFDWQPTVEGVSQGVINVAHSGKEQMTSIEVTGTFEELEDEEGSVSLNPEELDFGTSDGGIPISRSVVLTNNSGEEIEIEDVTIEAADRSGFEVKSKCPTTLKADGSCVVVVVWTPLSKGLAQGVLTVNHSGKESVASLEVSGTFTPDEVTSAEMYPDASPDKGLLVVDKEEIDFGADVDEAASIVISLVNKGNADLVIHDMSLSGLNNGIYFSKKGCYEGIELKPNAACPLIMNWLPKREGELVDSLQITHSGARGILVIPLTGTSTGISEQGLEMEKKATFDKEADVFFEDFFYEKMLEDGALDEETYFSDKIDLDAVKKEMVDIEAVEEVEETVISSHAKDRAILIKPDGKSVLVRDGGRVLIEEVRWDVTVIPEGVVLAAGDEVITLDFDDALIPANSSVSTSSSDADEGEPLTVPPTVEAAEEVDMVNPDVQDADQAIQEMIEEAVSSPTSTETFYNEDGSILE